MTNTLPAKADLSLLKKRAKKLLKQYRIGDADAIATVNTHHPKPDSFNVLRDAQLVIARSLGFQDWAELRDAAEKTQSKDRLLYCSFCGRSQHEVRKLIAGPKVFICDVCADLCIGILVEETGITNEEEATKPGEKLKPRDMPNLDAAIRKAQEFNLPTKKSTPKKKSTDDAKLSIAQVYESALDSGFSGVILVRHRGKIVLHDASGFADKARKILNTVDTVFDIGSITKQFTSSLIMSLQEAGLLKVTDTLKDHFANIPQDKADITIHQLLTHTAGFGDTFGDDTDAIDCDEFLKLAWDTQLEHAPGSKFRYSSVGYSIVTVIAEKVSGQSYEAALKKNVLEPAGLFETGYLLPDWSNHTLANGYQRNHRQEDSRPWAKDGPYWNLRGNGGMRATANDLLKWLDVLSGESVLTASSIDAMHGRHVDQYFGHDEPSDSTGFYGYGWVTVDKPSGVVHWHDGNNGYFYAYVERQVDKDLVIIGLSNQGRQELDRLYRKLKAAIL